MSNETQTQEVQAAVDTALKEQKKKKRKKRLIILGVILAIIVLGSALGSSGGGDSSTTDSSETTSAASAQLDTENNVDNYKVELKDSRVVKKDGENILVVNYLFTNNNDEPRSFSTSIDDKAYQDGIELGTVWSSYGINGLSFDNAQKEIKPGKTLEVQAAYELNDSTTTVDIELARIFSDNVQATFQIELKK